jgi:hypothetical protein
MSDKVAGLRYCITRDFEIYTDHILLLIKLLEVIRVLN